MPNFRHDWTERHTDGWRKHLGFISDHEEAHGFEIGCLEGRSSLWFCDHLLHQPKSTLICIDPYDYATERAISKNTPRFRPPAFNVEAVGRRFEENTAALQESGKIQFFKLEVPQALWQIPLKEQFDFGYIDGCHLASAVLSDAIHVWPYMKPNGIIIFDDVGWTKGQCPFPEEVWPVVAIEAFKTCFVGRCREIGRTNAQVFVEKLV
jgi:hypothetical protein